MKKLARLILSSLLILTLPGCNNDDNGDKNEEIIISGLSGYVQKGPFLNGTTLNLSELDENLNQTGLTFSSQVLDNSGNFFFDDMSLSSSVVLLGANGFFYNEVKGENSSASLTLRALVDLENKEHVNVNVLTHLQKDRIEKLIGEGISLEKAQDSTQTELLKNFGITNSNIVESDQLNMFIDSEDNAILIAISIIIQGDKTVSDFSEFLANINLDFSADGLIQEPSLVAELYRSAQSLDLNAVKTNLEERYSELGFDTEIPNFQAIVENFLTLQAPFQVEYEIEDLSCHGANDGSINITIEGGTPPFEFEWSNGQDTEDLSDLAEGSFAVTVTDANGNRLVVGNIEVNSPEELEMTYEVTQADLNMSSGAIDLSVVGGTAPYNFEWSNQETTEDVSGLEKGIYGVKITDANGCTLEQDVVVPEEIQISFEILNVPCYLESTGEIDLTVAGGLTPYNFEWSNNSNIEDLENLTAGTYSVTVTDQLGYSVSGEVALDQKAEILVDYQITRPTPGMNDGSINLSIDGGLAPFQYQWSDNSTLAQLNSVSSGQYSVTITDSNSCSVEVTIPVYGEFIDSRDGRSYRTVRVGSQIWFAENLKSMYDNQGNPISYFCFSGSPSNCENLGYMYSFEVSKTACPLGWKMPEETDWQELEQYLGMPVAELNIDGNRGDGIATRLKEGGDSLLEIQLTGAILGPNTVASSVFANESAIFWSNTMFNATNAIIRSLEYNHNAIYRTNIEIDHFASCLRCIKE